MPKVSRIVPVFNSEKTLARCLTSLVHQTLRDIEIILVNDCSTDRSYSIMLECEEQFPDIISVINLSENVGAGGARNIGISYARGEYLGFVDSDDYVESSMFEKLYSKAIEGNYDVVDCGFILEEKDKAILITTDEMTGILDAGKRELLAADAGYLVSKLFKKELWNDVVFREHAILEDLDTLYQIILKAQKWGNLKEVLYKYCYYPDSASKVTDPIKFHQSITEAIYGIRDKVFPIENYNEITEAVEFTVVRLCVADMAMISASDKKTDEKLTRLIISDISRIIDLMITIPIKENKYIADRIPRNSINNFLSNIDHFK